MKKAVLIGDSIRLIGYGTKVPELLKDACTVWQSKENAMFSAYTLRFIFDAREDIAGADVIHWNNGLWDTTNIFGDGNFTDKETYIKNMKRIAKILLTYGKKVIFATTTPVAPEHARNKQSYIKEYNEAVVPVLRDMGIVINDLYSLVAQNMDEYIRKDDHIHLTEAGIDACSKQVAQCIKENL